MALKHLLQENGISNIDGTYFIMNLKEDGLRQYVYNKKNDTLKYVDGTTESFINAGINEKYLPYSLWNDTYNELFYYGLGGYDKVNKEIDITHKIKQDTLSIDDYNIDGYNNKEIEELESLINAIKEQSRLVEEFKNNRTILKEYNRINNTINIGNIQLKEYHSKKDSKIIEINHELKRIFSIVINSDDQEKYYYNIETEQYEKININVLGKLLSYYYGIELFDNDLNKILQLCRDMETPNNNVINFNNVCLNVEDIKEFKTVSDKKVFTLKNIPYNYYNYQEHKNHWNNTLIEETLKKILIPANTPSEDGLYIDFLQRLGASFNRNNKHKLINLYTGTGNNGKGILKEIIKMVFNDLAITVDTGKIANDNFFKINLGNTNSLIIDELHKNSFNKTNIIASLKDITGGGEEQTRKIYDDQVITIKDYGMFWIFTNFIPYVPFEDTAYWRRLHIFNLPNEFLENVEDRPNQNVYRANPRLLEQLLMDTDGIEWLISRSIYEYNKKNQKDQPFIKTQTTTITQFLYDGKNPIRIFLETQLYEVEEQYNDRTVFKLAPKVIKYHFLNWCIKNGVTGKEIGISPANLSKEIGGKVKNIYPKAFQEAIKIDGYKHYRGLALNIDTDKTEYQDIDDEYLNEMIKTVYEDY